MNNVEQYRRRGVTMMEYGLLASLIGLVTIIAITLLGGNLGQLYCTVSSHIASSSDSISGCAPTASQAVLTKLNLPQNPTFSQTRDACINQQYVDYQDCAVQALEVAYPNPAAFLSMLGVKVTPNTAAIGSPAWNDALDQASAGCSATMGYPNGQIFTPGTMDEYDRVECVATAQAAAASIVTGKSSFYDGSSVSNSTGSITKWW